MAAYSYYPKFGKGLTSMANHYAGDVVTISVGSKAYSLPPSRFGFQSCQFTRFTLPDPEGFDEWGSPLFDLDGLGRCPLDDSPQTEEVRRDAERRRTANLYDRARS
jgi:hypothetical protein